MSEIIYGAIIGALVAGFISLLITYFNYYYKDKLDRQNIARSFAFEIKKLEKNLQILNKCDDNTKKDHPYTYSNAVYDMELPIYPKTGFYYQHCGAIVRFDKELANKLFEFYNNIIYADENFRRDNDPYQIVTYLKKAKKILEDEDFFDLLEKEISGSSKIYRNT